MGMPRQPEAWSICVQAGPFDGSIGIPLRCMAMSCPYTAYGTAGDMAFQPTKSEIPGDHHVRRMDHGNMSQRSIFSTLSLFFSRQAKRDQKKRRELFSSGRPPRTTIFLPSRLSSIDLPPFQRFSNPPFSPSFIPISETPILDD